MTVQMSAILPNFAGFTICWGSLHIRLIEPLGSGAYGVVYVGQDLTPYPDGVKYYAVKCLLRHPDGSDLARQQHRELANHRALSDHPNVVTLHATIEEEFYTFLVLDLCDGGDLFSAIIERNTYVQNTDAVKHTFLQIIDAVAACHEKGIYHRDLKPENVLCSRDDKHVYLADFGLSTRSKRSTNFGCGSSFYMSPECLGIFHKKSPYYTKPSDVWALGTILCNLLTGRNPWHIASPKTDDGFRIYLREGAAWLHKSLPISFAAAHLLGRIFDVDPSTRITLPELRTAIVAIDSFFPGAASDEAAAAIIRASWQLGPLRPSSPFSADFVEMSPDALAAAASATLVGTASTFVNGVDVDDVSSADGSDIWSIAGPPPLTISPQSSVTSEDVDEPITPETLPADADVVDPVESDFMLDEIDDRLAHKQHAVAAPDPLAKIKMDKKYSLSWSRLIGGVRGIKMRA